MEDLNKFHQIVGELLDHIGIEYSLEDSQDLVSLEIDDKYPIYLGIIDHDSFFIIANLGNSDNYNSMQILDFMRFNQISVNITKPIMALNDDGDINCYFSLSLSSTLPVLMQAFDNLLEAVDEFHYK